MCLIALYYRQVLVRSRGEMHLALAAPAGVSLVDSSALKHFLVQYYCARDLEAVASRLWILSTHSSVNVNTLHRPKVKGRDIIVTEDPRLHSVWINDRIFDKPYHRTSSRIRSGTNEVSD
jgi:hypothetical protein